MSIQLYPPYYGTSIHGTIHNVRDRIEFIQNKLTIPTNKTITIVITWSLVILRCIRAHQ